jgi:hypothetical protein
LTFVLPDHHPRLLHLSPYLRGDALGAIGLAARLRDRGLVWGIDQNGVCDAEGCTWVQHWPEYRQQYPFVWTGRYVGRGPTRREERIRVPDHWPAKLWDLKSEQVARLRSRRLGGRRPHPARAHFHRAAEYGVPLMLEVKHSPGFRHAATWAKLEKDRRDTGAHRVGIMTLQTQWVTDEVAYEVAELAVEHKFPVALLPRRGRPKDWQKWILLGVRRWGPWR